MWINWPFQEWHEQVKHKFLHIIFPLDTFVIVVYFVYCLCPDLFKISSILNVICSFFYVFFFVFGVKTVYEFTSIGWISNGCGCVWWSLVRTLSKAPLQDIFPINFLWCLSKMNLVISSKGNRKCHEIKLN